MLELNLIRTTEENIINEKNTKGVKHSCEKKIELKEI